MCTHGKCVNMNGGYMCICSPGFVAAPDGKVCIGKIKIFVVVRLWIKIWIVTVDSHSHMYHSSVKYKTVMVDNTCINKSTINYRNKSDRSQYNISPDLGQA